MHREVKLKRCRMWEQKERLTSHLKNMNAVKAGREKRARVKRSPRRPRGEPGQPQRLRAQSSPAPPRRPQHAARRRPEMAHGVEPRRYAGLRTPQGPRERVGSVGLCPFLPLGPFV